MGRDSVEVLFPDPDVCYELFKGLINNILQVRVISQFFLVFGETIMIDLVSKFLPLVVSTNHVSRDF